MNYRQLEELHNLKEKGIITEEEFQQQKQKILKGVPVVNDSILSKKNLGMETPTYLLLMHLAQLIPTLGWIVSIVMWAINKDNDAQVDAHGKVIINWLISALIYGVVFGIISMILIGIPLLIALGICCLIFPIVGAVKANNGEFWKYPLSLDILR